MKTALIFGAGSGISAAFAHRLHERGYRIALAARNGDRLKALAADVDAAVLTADAADSNSVAAAFGQLDQTFGHLDVVLYNAAQRVRGPIAELDPAAVLQAIHVTAFGGFLVAQQAARRMLAKGQGTIMFTGASASVKGYPESATFAMGKFALRGLAQSMARELHPKGVHVAHFVIDGGVRNGERGRVEAAGAPDSLLDPGAIADSYIHVMEQPRSAWSWEIEVRPWTERF
ncbi:unnamed protein product [Phaeothamnion confervicola]